MERPTIRPAVFALVLSLLLVVAACSPADPGASVGEPEPGGDPSQGVTNPY
ncbi:MAG TPA: hypothetical protein VIA02_10140 [Candidatus Limnocylindria bacterium]|jgi:hypothetical protein